MLLSRSELESLTQTYDQWHVSIYMPTHRAGDDIQQDPIRLKNLLDEAEELLREEGLSPAEIEALLTPGWDLVEDEIFWQHQSDGLALFIASDMVRYYRLPFDFDELTVVSERFHLKPLLPLLSEDGRFYLLALSQDNVRLFQGTRYSIDEVELEAVPDGLSEVLRWDDPERRLQMHTGSEAVIDGAEAVFHGHGVASEDDPKEYIRRYFHRVEEGVSDMLAGEHIPLVLAGVDYLHPIYREANDYPHLVEEGIEGNPGAFGVDELHERAWNIVQPIFVTDRREAAAQYEQLVGSGSDLASSEMMEIVRAAYYERVDTVFVAIGEQQWGTFDPETSEVRLHQEPQPGDQDLLDFAAVHTLLNGGAAYALEREAMPVDAPLAALLRY